ncbi:MAG: histidine phosphatase family protein [Verrucomicrobiaceae bacterium]
MKYLTLIRHAKSSWDDTMLNDHDRPLNERGLCAAPLVGKFLSKTYFGSNGTPALLARPDRLISSTAHRAAETAALMAMEMGTEQAALDRSLYLAEPKSLLRFVRELDDRWKHVMIFAHNPGISDFADRLLKRGEVVDMPTCAAVLIALPWESWAATDWEEGRLIGYVTPKLIEKRFSEELIPGQK